MKRILLILMMLMLIVCSGCSKEPVLITEEIQQEVELPTNGFQDIRYWSYDNAKALNVPKERSKTSYVEYYVSQIEVENYINMLLENGFTLVNSYENRYLVSYALTYDALPEADTFASTYKMVDCHLNFWSKEKGKFRIEYINDLVMCDMGLRDDGAEVDLGLQGPSAKTGLYRLGDGSYQTSDQRLTTKVGSAMVIRDGETYTCSTRYDLEGNKEGIWIEDYFEDEGMYLLTQLGSMTSGTILQSRDVERRYTKYKTDEKYNIKNYTWDMPLFLMEYNDGWGGPKLSSSDFEALTIRVLHYEENAEAVYYIYARLKDSEPSEVEVLCAVSTVPTQEEESEKDVSAIFENKDVATMKINDTIMLKDTRHEFGSSYHVYEWEIEEGKDLVDIEFSGGNKCYVTSKGKGEVVIASRYSYTEEGSDVLTGNKRTNAKTKTYRFTITIE